jgi:outer membrane biosynthesis protein TonB
MKYFLASVFLLTVAVCALGQTNDTAKLLSIKEYVIPAEASAAGIDGQLGIAVWVNKQGSVDRAEVVAGPSWPCNSSPKNEIQKVRDGARDNMMTAKFSPAMKDGKPQSAELFLTMTIGQTYEDFKKRKQQSAEKKDTDAEPHLIQGGVINGKALSLPKPEYPPEARATHASGVVEVEVLIDERGKVILAGAKNGLPALQNVSRDAACGARFSPTLLAGHPVKVSGIITYNFVP